MKKTFSFTYDSSKIAREVKVSLVTFLIISLLGMVPFELGKSILPISVIFGDNTSFDIIAGSILCWWFGLVLLSIILGIVYIIYFLHKKIKKSEWVDRI